MSIAVTSLVRFLADYTFSRTETFSKDFANSITTRIESFLGKRNQLLPKNQAVAGLLCWIILSIGSL
jgi:hypothetical protein